MMAEKIRLRVSTAARIGYGLRDRRARAVITIVIVMALCGGIAWQWPVIYSEFLRVTGLESTEVATERAARATAAAKLEMTLTSAADLPEPESHATQVLPAWRALQKSLARGEEALQDARARSSVLDDARRRVVHDREAYEIALGQQKLDEEAERQRREAAAEAQRKKAAEEAAARAAAEEAAREQEQREREAASPPQGTAPSPEQPPSSARASTSAAVACPPGGEAVVTAVGGGLVQVSGGGASSSGSGSATIVVPPEAVFTAHASADGSVRLEWSCR